ncbi:MAG TPA: histidine triad nucleotide-binding protein [Anaerolineae bacterium]|nr:histidine triad nucleotide-binding protein [Anaerolineae bacterium]
MEDCVFCQIIADKASSKVVYRDEQVTAFLDRRPATPVHLLVVPNRHITSLNQVNKEHEGLLGHMIVVAKQLAKEQGVDQDGYRLVINTGPNAGQSVFHLHLHLIAGRPLPIYLG